RGEPGRSGRVTTQGFAGPCAQPGGAGGTTVTEGRAGRATRLSQVSYEDLLRDRLAYGTPDMVVERLKQLRDELGLSGVVIEPNVGGGMSREQVSRSVRLFAQEVAPRLR